jgi:hypothetical protein
MKRDQLKYLFSISFVIAFLVCNNAIAQEDTTAAGPEEVAPVEKAEVVEAEDDKPKITTAEDYRVSLDFVVTKQEDNTRLLVATYEGKNKKDRKDIMPVYNAEIKFYNVSGDNEVLLGTAKTSKTGLAKLIVPADKKYLKDGEGNIVLVARFEGTDGLDAEEAEVSFKDLFLELSLAVVDSVRTVTARGYTLDSTGTKTPVEEVDIAFYIGSMLANMKVEEGALSGGEYEFELKEQVPGDPEGNVDVYVMVEDNEVFGNVKQKKSMKWGTTLLEDPNKNDNTLWSEAAPIWMYVVLTILLVGVWANYVYTVINLFKIKKEASSLEIDN